MTALSALTNLKEIEGRANAATPGPWEEYDANEGEYRPAWCVANDEFHNPSPNDDIPWLAIELHTGCHDDATFIAHSRADIPDLIAAVELLREVVGKMSNLELPAAFFRDGDSARTSVLIHDFGWTSDEAAALRWALEGER
ncbi:MAG: hypothetical protein KGL39_57845 [Patescibacteria group bacterium]|nr:hypothetical protein [Patescibacteria group bacterium]